MYDTKQVSLRNDHHAALRAHLDDLAAAVADLLERGDDVGAWGVTWALERVLDPDWRLEPRPSWPVIARRFAAIHRRLLLAARGGIPRAAAALDVAVPIAAPKPVAARSARRFRWRIQRPIAPA